MYLRKTDMGKIDTVLDRKLNKTFIEVNKINYEETLTEEKEKNKRLNNMMTCLFRAYIKIA